MSLENVLASIPGYAGYKAAEQNTQNREIGDLQKAHTLQAILAQIQAQELNKQFAGAMASGGGTPEQLDTLATKLAAGGHPGAAALSGLADKRRKAIADAATLKTIQSPASPGAGRSFDTPLSPQEESAFQSWKAKYAQNDSGGDYDLRGAFKAGLEPDSQTGHWPDTFKKPNHPTFSNESQYAKFGNPGRWEGEKFIPPQPRADGGLFSTLMQSEVPAIANQAKLLQQQANVSDPRSVSPQHWVDLQRQLAAQESSLLERRTAAQTRVDNRPPPKEAAPPAAGTALSEDALNNAAARYKLDGTFPPNLGRGAQKDVVIATILNKAAALAKEEGNSGEAARLTQISGRASTQALGQLVKQKNMVLAFEKNAVMNADLALQASEQVDRIGSPVLDRWLQAGKKNVVGDVNVAKLDAAMRTFVNEYARVTTSVTGGGVTSDSARREIDELLRAAHTKEQVRGVIQQMKLEMENRRHGYEQQEAELKRGISSSVPPAPTVAETPPPGAAAPATTNKVGDKSKSKSGKAITWDGKQWVYD